DGAHGLVGREVARMEVDGVAHAAVVDERDLEHVTDAPPQGGPDAAAVEGPPALPDAGGHLEGDLLDGEGVAVDGAGRCGGRGDGVDDVAEGRVGVDDHRLTRAGAVAVVLALALV